MWIVALLRFIICSDEKQQLKNEIFEVFPTHILGYMKAKEDTMKYSC